MLKKKPFSNPVLMVQEHTTLLTCNSSRCHFITPAALEAHRPLASISRMQESTTIGLWVLWAFTSVVRSQQ